METVRTTRTCQSTRKPVPASCQDRIRCPDLDDNNMTQNTCRTPSNTVQSESHVRKQNERLDGKGNCPERRSNGFPLWPVTSLTASAVPLIGSISGTSDLRLSSLLDLAAGLLLDCAGGGCDRHAASSSPCNMRTLATVNSSNFSLGISPSIRPCVSPLCCASRSCCPQSSLSSVRLREHCPPCPRFQTLAMHRSSLGTAAKVWWVSSLHHCSRRQTSSEKKNQDCSRNQEKSFA